MWIQKGTRSEPNSSLIASIYENPKTFARKRQAWRRKLYWGWLYWRQLWLWYDEAKTGSPFGSAFSEGKNDYDMTRQTSDVGGAAHQKQNTSLERKHEFLANSISAERRELFFEFFSCFFFSDQFNCEKSPRLCGETVNAIHIQRNLTSRYVRENQKGFQTHIFHRHMKNE